MTQNNFFDSMLYHKIARDKSFCNELYPCAPIVRLVIFFDKNIAKLGICVGR